ncbi:MAG: amidohydrolase family protein [Saprospiraceae bacterium]|nr:amidohydrolase family protein [Saprospiraceae bacterium]
MNLRFLPFFAGLLIAFTAVAQRPIPAKPQSAPILILGATAHLGNGQTIANSAIGFENGKITLVADATTIRLDRTKYSKIFDASGKHVYPGFIALNTRLGLVEIDAARPTVDFSDVGAYNPNLRALVAYNTDSDVIPTIRSNGILLAQSTPEGGTMSGTSSVVQLDAWNWEDAAFRADDGHWLNWPAIRTSGGFGSGTPEARNNDQYGKNIEEILRFFEEAKAYAAQTAPEVKNLKFEAMKGLFSQKQALYIRVGNVKAIQDAVLFAKNFGFRTVVVGGEDSWMIADFLKTNNVSVVLAPPQSLPGRDDDDVDQPYKTAAQLHDKGVTFTVTSIGGWRQRNLPFQVGQVCGFGLPKEAAVSAITLNAAKILGIDAACGSLETGKDATLFISEGDALDMRTCIVTAAFIQGREINLDNKHKQLSKRFEEKYKQ